MQVITRIEDDDSLKNVKTKPTYRRKFPYPGWLWRLSCISFKNIFEGIFTESAEIEIFKMFDILVEILIVNYTHFNRKHKDFHKIIVRYWFLIAAFTIQLQIVFNAEEEAKLIDDTYIHKVLVHSTRIFIKYNLASYSCESGEGDVSVSNRVGRNGVYNDKDASIRLMVDYHVLNEELKVLKNVKDPHPEYGWIILN